MILNEQKKKMWVMDVVIALAVLWVVFVMFLYRPARPLGLMDQPFYAVDDTFPYLKSMNAPTVFSDVRREVTQLLPGPWTPWPEKYLYDGHWTVYPFKVMGDWKDEYCARCPTLVEHLRQIPRLVTAILSRLAPNTHLKPHQGWANLSNRVLRCHLGIVVPGHATIVCDDRVVSQQENQWIIFDDSKMHCAHNYSDRERIVLLLDIERPWWVVPGQSRVQDTKELKAILNAV